MKHTSTSIFFILLSLTSLLSAMTPEIQQAIALWENGKEVDAFPILLRYKDSDDADALAYLGRSYMNGRGVDKDTSLAFGYFGKAAAKNHPYGLNGMGVCYEYGLGVKQDLQKAEQYLKQAAQANCPLSEFNLGLLYSGRLKVAEGAPPIPDFGNGKKAMEHFRASYDAGNMKPQSAEHIGFLLLDGETPQEAIKWFQEAAENNQILSLFELAERYENGKLVPMNRNHAIDYAEKLGRIMGNYKVYTGICYRMGIEYLFLNQLHEAMQVLQKAADAGHVDAQYQLAMFHPDNSIRGKYALMAARNGNRQMLVRAGAYLAQQKQFDEAMRLYLEAVKDGSLEAMCEIAIMHRLGEGVPVNYEKAMEWYEKAAAQYYPRALRELGLKYMIKDKNDPVMTQIIKYEIDSSNDFYTSPPFNHSKGCAYIAMALFLGDKGASDNLFTYSLSNLDNEMELAVGILEGYYGRREKGSQLLMKSASHGNVDAMNMLGHLYSHSDTSLRDVGTSAKYFQMAAAKGNDHAEKQLCSNEFSATLDEELSLKFLKTQAAKGYGVALYNLAEFYRDKGDMKKTMELHLQNARNGNDRSITQLYLYTISSFSSEKLPCDAKELEQLLDKAVVRHDSVAELIRSDFTGGNFRESAILLMRSIIDGAKMPVAFERLGQLFLQGNGVPCKTDLAVVLFNEAVKAGYWETCTVLGDILSTGKYSIPKNIEQARIFFKIGAEHGVEACKQRLEKLSTKDSKPGE